MRRPRRRRVFGHNRRKIGRLEQAEHNNNLEKINHAIRQGMYKYTKRYMISDIIKQKRDSLIKQGWVESQPTFDFDYFNEVSSTTFTKDLGYFVSKVTEKLSENWFSLFGEDIDNAKNNFVRSICPPIFIPQPPPATAFIQACWPFNINDYNSHIEAAFEELTYRIIIRIVKLLGTPNSVHQALGNNNEVVLTYDPERFDLDEVIVLGNMILMWDDVYLKVERTQSWNDNGAITAYQYNLHSSKIREYSSQVLYNIGLELNPSTYQLGDLDPEFEVNSFPEYIRSHTYNLEVDMGLKRGATWTNNLPERYNILVVGPPGYGKTRWSQAFAAEVLAKLGYLVLVIDYSTLQDLVIPSYIGKVCIVINDADTLALDRDLSERGETEQVLAWLDGARTTYIKPFYLDKRSSVVTIMTANSINKWDPAALRQGRIHKFMEFDKVQLSDV